MDGGKGSFLYPLQNPDNKIHRRYSQSASFLTRNDLTRCRLRLRLIPPGIPGGTERCLRVELTPFVPSYSHKCLGFGDP